MKRVIRHQLVFILAAVSAFAGVPDLIDFQGSLVDNDGVPVTGTSTIQFALYSANTDGAAIWSETKLVVLQDGVYSIQLGDLTALTDDIWENAQLWLGIKVEPDDEMTPRVRIVAVPYAIRAKTAEVAEEVADAARRGSIFFHNTYLSDGTNFYSLSGQEITGLPSDNSFAKRLIPRDGEICNLFIRPEISQPADAHATFTIRVNDTDTALSVTHVFAVNGLDPVENTTDQVTVNQGDMFSLKVQASAFPSNALHPYRISYEIK